MPSERIARVRGEFVQLSRLAVPISVTQAGQAMFGVVDAAVVGHLSATALSAVGVGNAIFFGVSVFGIGLMLGMDPLLSQAVGAGRPERARQLLWQALALAALTSAALAIPLGLLPGLLEPTGTDPEIAREAWGYVLYRLPGLPGLLVFIALRAYLQSVGRPGILVVAVVVANVFHLGADLLLVFGGASLPAWTGPLQDVPAFGARGAAIATSFSTWLEVAIAVFAVHRLKVANLPGRFRRPVVADLRQASRVGLPVGAHMGAEVGVFMLASILASHISKQSAAAHQIALALASLTFTFALGIGNAGSVRVGWAVGAGDTAQARLAGLTAFAAGGLFMVGAAAFFILFPGPIVALMTNQQDVIAAAVPLLFVAAMFQISDGIQGVGAGVLRGAGDSRFTFAANMVGHYLVGLPLTLLLGFHLGQGITGIWWGLCLGLTVVAAALLWRFLRLSARPIRALERTHEPSGS